MSVKTPRFRHSQGIAIGPILFVIALLALLATVMSSGFGDFGVASVADRISADIPSQANLIRAKINECSIKYGTNNNGDSYPASDTTNGTLVSALECEGDPVGQKNIWSGQRATVLPQPTTGFNQWYYLNSNGAGMGGNADGGRCIWITPSGSNPAGSSALVTGLTKAASKFSHNTGFSSSAEVVYDPSSSSQKFVMWITLPTGTPDSNCLP
ncbi:MAG: hypothetical protein WAO98_11255 [Alphaproteobacteria bacterium]